ncbi:hypothetical protein QVD17_14922 [Tagetes erecta]|uniref:Uncharacterized protein n=1 Tax=Tagetes erecta TaxID=13708 RepID=A0AAD8KTW9_TARER|nr:hypothetical protein QVD17_14922 [Tagetes erecta]
MSTRGRGRGGSAGDGGRGRGRNSFQPSPSSSQVPAGVQHSVHRVPVQSVSSSTISEEMKNMSIASSSHSSPAPGGARVTTTVPVPQQPAMLQQVADAPPPPRAVPLIPSSSKKLSTPARPGPGTIGRKLVIKANHFLVDLGQKDPYQYDVAISPEVTSKTKCREIMTLLTTSFGVSHLGNLMLAYDGNKSAFAAGPLPFESKEFVIKINERRGREREFKVTIKFAAKKDLHHLRQFINGRQHDSPHETIQALDVVLRESASKDREAVGRSLFSAEFGRGDLGDGIEFWKGFYQSLRPTQMGLSLNIDMSARAFYEHKLASDFVKEFLNKDISRPLTDQERIKVKRAFRGVRMEVRLQDNCRRYKFQDLTRQPLNQLTFVDATGATVSVVNYYREKYNIQLRFPLLPAIQAGTEAKPTYLPMELCWVVEGQRYASKLNEKQVTNLLRATCQRPMDREKSIMKTMQSNKYNDDALVNTEFGMRVREQFTSIDARVLPPPPIRYHGTSEVTPQVGQWNMIELKMNDGGRVENWAIVNFSRQRVDAVRQFCDGLVRMCNDKGIVFKSNPVIPMCTAQPHNIERTLGDIHSRCQAQLARDSPGSQLQLLFVILPEVKGSYGKIKRVCETELGIVTQCCRPAHVMKLSKQYFENVAMKINVKVGGRNSVLSASLNGRLPYVTERPTIIFGADVTHPAKGEDSTPSIAAVVASMDWPQVSKYKALVSAQSHRQEIIQDLHTTTTDAKRGVVHGGMIRELLISFKKATGHKPHRIIFYRDGVSEGQFNEVLLNEMDKIRKACVSLEENYMPPVTFIIVQKRHHTRFFPAKHGDRATTDRSGNILPGTVVDTKICHPTEFDFYLCSHAGIQGTSRPAHYHVLYDENKFTADGLQMLTNSLCYTYARCTRSVSIVPPAYYAHLAAFRARSYMEGGDLTDSDSRSGQRATRDKVSEVRPLPAIHESVKSVMFYC